MADNNNTNSTTPGVDSTSTQSNTTPKHRANNNTTTPGVDNTTIDGTTTTTTNNYTNDNNTPQPLTSHQDNNNTDKNNYTNNTNNFTPADVNAVSSSTPQSGLPRRQLESLPNYNNEPTEAVEEVVTQTTEISIEDAIVKVKQLSSLVQENTNQRNLEELNRYNKMLMKQKDAAESNNDIIQNLEMNKKRKSNEQYQQFGIDEIVIKSVLQSMGELKVFFDKFVSEAASDRYELKEDNNNLQDILGSLTRHIDHLTQHIDDLENIQQQSEASRKAGIELQQSYLAVLICAKKLLDENTKFKVQDSKVAFLEDERTRLVSEVDRLTKLVELSKRDNVVKKVDELSNQLSNLKVGESENLVEKERLSGELEQAKSEVGELTISLDRALSEVDRLQSEGDKLCEKSISTIKFLGTRADQAKAELRAAEQEIDQVKEELCDAEQARTVTQTELDKEKVRVSDLQAELEKERNEHTSAIESTLVSAHAILAEEQANTSAVKAEFNEQIAALNRVGESVQAQLDEEREKRTSSKAELKEERKKIAELEAKIKALSVDSMEKAGESTVEGAAAAPEEDDNGDDKMTEVDVEEKTSAGEHSEPKEKLAMSDVEIDNEPTNKSNDDDTAEPIREMTSSSAEQTPNQEKRVELDESEGSSPQLEKSDAEISKWEDKVTELQQALASSQSPEEKKVLHQKIALCFNLRGAAHLKNGRIKEAAEDFQRVLKFSDATHSTKMNAIMNHAKANYISHSQHNTRLAPLQLPAEMMNYCDNKTFHKASSELRSAGPLKADAEKSNRNFCAFDCKIKDSPDSLRKQVAVSPPADVVTPPVTQVPEPQQPIVEQAITKEPQKIVFALFHYTSNKKHNLHENGSLYSGGENCHPFSPTSGPFVELWTNSLTHGLQLDAQNALPFSMNQIVWGNRFSLDGDFDDASNAQKKAAFEKLVEETETNNLKFVLENIKLLGKDTEVFMMIFSNASWNFYKQHESKFPSNVKVIQDRSLVHTCLMSQTIGITERQAFTLVDVMIKTQSKLIGLDTPPKVTKELVRKVIGPGRINSTVSDKYVYVGRYNKVIILVGGGFEAFLQLLIDEEATTGNFPNQPTIQHNTENGTATKHAGLEVEIHRFDSDEVASLNTGPQDHVNKSEYLKWYKCSEKRQAYNGDRIASYVTKVFVAIYNKKIIFYSPDGHEQLKTMLRFEGATFGGKNFPTQTMLKNGQGYEVVELTIKMYASSSVEAAKFRDTMKPGPQDSKEFRAWRDKIMTKAEITVHLVKPGTNEVANWLDTSITALRQLINNENMKMLKPNKDALSKLNNDLGKVGLKFGYVQGCKKPSWDNVREAKESIKGRKSILIWINVKEGTTGAIPKTGKGMPKNIFHAPFILSGVQLDPEHKASVVLDKNGIEEVEEVRSRRSRSSRSSRSKRKKSI